MKTAAHMRMARAALGWSQTDLAEAGNVHVQTIKRMETLGFEGIKSTTVEIVHEAFIGAGIKFLPNGCVCPPEQKISKSKGGKK